MKNRILILMLLTLIGTTSCKKFVEGVNEDPNNFTDAPATLIIGQAQLAAIMTAESQPARLAGVFTDQFTGADRQFITYDRYGVTSGDFDNMWDIIYQRGLSQAKLAMTKAAADGNTELEGVSEIFYAYFLGEAALLFGDVPGSEAANEQIDNPHYDHQQDVLNLAIAKLDDALTKVGNNNNFSEPFVSNSLSWQEVAHSLKARYYLAMKDYNNALTEAQLGISSSDGDLLAKHGTATGSKNLFYQFGFEQRAGYMTVDGSGANNGQGSTLKRWLTNGRPSGLLTPGDTNRDAVYFDGFGLNFNAGGYFAIDASFPIISWVETKLIEAEAAARTGGDGLTPFNAVRSHLEIEYNAPGGFPASASTGSQLIREILEEKYISLIGSLQVFQDIRRTDNVIGVQVKGTGAPSIPQRFLYPETEHNSNKNFPGLVDLFTKTQINL